MNKIKSGFTLAEVLITLGIIGVVAAMTIPVLIQKYEKLVIKTQFKKTYSVLQSAFALSLMDYGENIDCFGGAGVDGTAHTGCREFWMNGVFKKLKVQKVCEDKAYENGCVPDYSDKDFPTTEGCGGFMASQIKNKSSAVVLNDGTILFPYGWNKTQYGVLGIDLNGMKGPNLGGYDVYAIVINKDNNRYILGGMLNNKGRQQLNACLPYTDNPLFLYLDDILK